MKFVTPPGWPPPKQGWIPPAAWSPPAGWPKAPAGWQFYSGEYGEPVAAPPGAWDPSGWVTPSLPPPPPPYATPQQIEPAAAGGSWTARDVRLVLLFGLVGGLVSCLVIAGWIRLLNSSLYALMADGPMWLPAVLYAGVSAILTTTHGLFVGLRVGKPGAIVATLAASLLTFVPADILLQLVLSPEYGTPVLESIGITIRYTGGGMLAVGLAGELLRLAVAKLPESILARALVGLAVPVGWTIHFLVLPVIGLPESWASQFEPSDWLLWLVAMVVLSLPLSGLLPALLSGRPTPEPAAPSSFPIAPGFAGQQEHPKATQVLILGVIGLVAFTPLAIAAWVVGAKAKAEMERDPGRYAPSSSLQTGYVLGIIGTVLCALTVLALLVVVVVALATSGSAR